MILTPEIVKESMHDVWGDNLVTYPVQISHAPITSLVYAQIGIPIAFISEEIIFFPTFRLDGNRIYEKIINNQPYTVLSDNWDCYMVIDQQEVLSSNNGPDTDIMFINKNLMIFMYLASFYAKLQKGDISPQDFINLVFACDPDSIKRFGFWSGAILQYCDDYHYTGDLRFPFE